MEEGVVEEFKRAVGKVCEGEKVVAAYLFGSFARDEEDERSDVDVALLFEESGYDIHRLLDLARKIEEQLEPDREIDVRALNGKNLVFQKNVIEDSILLFEEDEEKRMDFERRVFRRFLDMKPHIQQYYDMRSERIGV